MHLSSLSSSSIAMSGMRLFQCSMKTQFLCWMLYWSTFASLSYDNYRKSSRSITFEKGLNERLHLLKFVCFLTYARFLSVPCPQDNSWKSSSEPIREKQPAPQISINSVCLLERDRGDQVSLCKHNFFTQDWIDLRPSHHHRTSK